MITPVVLQPTGECVMDAGEAYEVRWLQRGATHRIAEKQEVNECAAPREVQDWPAVSWGWQMASVGQNAQVCIVISPDHASCDQHEGVFGRVGPALSQQAGAILDLRPAPSHRR